MERFEHGGDVWERPGVLDFSASLNPLGMPERAAEALRASVRLFERYPDPRCWEFERALAAFEQVDPAWVLACAGATDAIARLCGARRGRRALVCAPAYLGYEQALDQAGVEVVRFALDESDDFAVGRPLAAAIDTNIDLVFLANPNNPTGRCLDRDVLLACLERAGERGALVVLDECFVDLTAHRGSNELLARFPHLVIVKALTKSFALAGLRVGYALCSDGQLLAQLRAAGQPWAVSVPAQVAGVACLGEEGYLERGRQLIACERTRLRDALGEHGLHVLPSDANYLLFRAGEGLDGRLLAKGILIRSCENFAGLGRGWYRIAVRTPQENDRLIEALGEVMA